jgi:hypothetical protein
MKFIHPHFLTQKTNVFSFVREAHSMVTSGSFSQDVKSISLSKVPITIAGYKCQSPAMHFKRRWLVLSSWPGFLVFNLAFMHHPNCGTKNIPSYNLTISILVLSPIHKTLVSDSHLTIIRCGPKISPSNQTKFLKLLFCRFWPCITER